METQILENILFLEYLTIGMVQKPNDTEFSTR